MKKKTVSKTVLLPLMDGRKVRVERNKICCVALRYSLFSKTPVTTVIIAKVDYRVNLSIDAAKRLIYGDDYEESE